MSVILVGLIILFLTVTYLPKVGPAKNGFAGRDGLRRERTFAGRKTFAGRWDSQHCTMFLRLAPAILLLSSSSATWSGLSPPLRLRGGDGGVKVLNLNQKDPSDVNVRLPDVVIDSIGKFDNWDHRECCVSNAHQWKEYMNEFVKKDLPDIPKVFYRPAHMHIRTLRAQKENAHKCHGHRHLKKVSVSVECIVLILRSVTFFWRARTAWYIKYMCISIYIHMCSLANSVCPCAV